MNRKRECREGVYQAPEWQQYFIAQALEWQQFFIAQSRVTQGGDKSNGHILENTNCLPTDIAGLHIIII